MREADLIELFVAPLERLGVRYLVTGSVAATLYGEPRATHDIDLVANLSAEDGERLTAAFPAASFYTPPAEVIALEAAREGRGHFNVIHSESGLKADFYLAGRDPLHAWAFRHAREYSIAGLRVRLAPAEYVILRKLEFYREGGSEKHLRDIRSMLALSPEALDRRDLADWIHRLGLERQWAEVGEGKL
jgi:hypothetical protein